MRANATASRSDDGLGPGSSCWGGIGFGLESGSCVLARAPPPELVAEAGAEPEPPSAGKAPPGERTGVRVGGVTGSEVPLRVLPLAALAEKLKKVTLTEVEVSFYITVIAVNQNALTRNL